MSQSAWNPDQHVSAWQSLDNAFVESFIRTLKYEEVYLNEYETFSDALDNIPHFIEDVYNKKRLHSAIGYRSPIDFEKEKEREMEMEKGVKVSKVGSFKYCFLTSCILTGVHPR